MSDTDKKPENQSQPFSFEDYQSIADMTSGRDKHSHISWVSYLALGLAEEAGEVASHFAHAIRDEGFCIPRVCEGQRPPYLPSIGFERRERIKKELGDVLWFITELAREMDMTLEQVAVANNIKLMDRLTRNKIHGEGDDR